MLLPPRRRDKTQRNLSETRRKLCASAVRFLFGITTELTWGETEFT
ncbi:MAG: hypothetical protein ACR2MG_04220 [Pyrinomonadaceae bacterium]